MRKDKNSTFTPQHHALLFGLIAKGVIGHFGHKGEKAIIEGIKRYGQQRGRRMAKRVKGDGCKLTLLNYFIYGEWEAPKGELDSTFPVTSPDLNMKVYKCPWYTEWKENNLVEYAYLYCQYVDAALLKGFNPNLELVVTENLTAGGNCCCFWFKNADFSKKDLDTIRLRKQNLGKKVVMPWEYHTGHIYKTMEEVIIYKFGKNGKKVMQNAMNNFSIKYGKQAARKIMEFKKCNFDELPDYKGIKGYF